MKSIMPGAQFLQPDGLYKEWTHDGSKVRYLNPKTGEVGDWLEGVKNDKGEYLDHFGLPIKPTTKRDR